MERFQNKYRVQSNRKPNWDYSGNGVYFITIVTQNRECNLGHIVVETDGRGDVETDGRLSLRFSDFGNIVNDEWLKSFQIRNELYLDEYIIMPNHLHAIVILDKSGNEQTIKQSISQPAFIRKPKSISSFIAGFKSVINSKIDDFIDQHNLNIPKYNRNNHFFQPNYHDHVIRNDSEYRRIKEYIITNPIKWKGDKLNPTNNQQMNYEM